LRDVKPGGHAADECNARLRSAAVGRNDPSFWNGNAQTSSQKGRVQEQTDGKVSLDFEKNVNGRLPENDVPAAGIGLIENGEIKFVKVFGDLGKGTPGPDNAIINVASITKNVVIMLTFRLVETGQWNLDEPLSEYWVDPDVANDSLHSKLTTRHVLTHHTGSIIGAGTIRMANSHLIFPRGQDTSIQAKRLNICDMP
jgi:CubicO group peptidase (beta-lactamase class C family)